MLGELPTAPREPVDPLGPEPPLVLPPAPLPAPVDPAAAPPLTVVAAEAFGAVAAGDEAAAPAPVWSAEVVVTVESLVALAEGLTAAFLPPPPHAPRAEMTTMHSRIRRTQLPPHCRSAIDGPAIEDRAEGSSRPATVAYPFRHNWRVDGNALRPRWHRLVDAFGAPPALVDATYE